MAKKDELKKLLREAVAEQRKLISEPQIDRAATELEKKAQVEIANIRELGESVVGDKEAFVVMDIDEINDILRKP